MAHIKKTTILDSVGDPEVPAPAEEQTKNALQKLGSVASETPAKPGVPAVLDAEPKKK